MKTFYFLLLAFPLQLFAQKDGSGENDLRCIISADKQVYHHGEIPKIIVEIKNNSNEPVILVKELDGSENKWRFPHAYFTITKIGDTAYKTRFTGRCGNMNQIRPGDFVKVKPGSTFYPYYHFYPERPDNVYAHDFRLFDSANFSATGKYLIRFYYSTNEADFEKWKGRFSGEPTEKQLKEMIALFAKVPKIELESNKLMIEVK
jgi:hypothetical protein